MLKALFLLFIILIFSVGTSGQSPYVDSLLRITELNKHDDAEMKAFNLLAQESSRSNPNKAKAYLAQSIQLASQANNYDRLCAAYVMLLSLYQVEGKMDSAAVCINNLKIIAGKATQNKVVQGNYNQAMGLYYKKNGDYKTALPYALAAVKLIEEGNLGTKSDIAGRWLNAGNVYQGLGEYSMAMDCHFKALRFFEESGNKLGESFCYTNMAVLYNMLKQYPNALRSAQKSLEIKTQLNDKRGICTALEAIGLAYLNMGHLTQSFSNFESALKLSISEKIPMTEQVCYFNMAKIFVAQGKDSLAIIYFKESKTVALQLNNQPLVANAEIELATLYKSADSLKHTEKTLFTSLKTFKETGNLQEEADNYRRLSGFYAANKQYEKALLYTGKYYDIKDSIAGINVQVQLKKIEEQYNSEKKEKEIALLKKDKELQQQKLFRQRLLFSGAAVLLILSLIGITLLINRNRLKQKMKELELRNQIAADLHDEVGSSLSSIHMLSQMATQPGNEATHKDILGRMSNNAKETMDKMGDIVWMIKPGETEARSLSHRMQHFTYEICSSKNIDASVKIDDLEKVKLTMEQRKNIYLIFKEALNNAVKYSGTKKVEISSAINTGELLLSIVDYGNGFNNSIVKKGNGLDNMQHRALELHGQLKIMSGPARGTTILLSVPV